MPSWIQGSTLAFALTWVCRPAAVVALMRQDTTPAADGLKETDNDAPLALPDTAAAPVHEYSMRCALVAWACSVSA